MKALYIVSTAIREEGDPGKETFAVPVCVEFWTKPPPLLPLGKEATTI